MIEDASPTDHSFRRPAATFIALSFFIAAIIFLIFSMGPYSSGGSISDLYFRQELAFLVLLVIVVQLVLLSRNMDLFAALVVYSFAVLAMVFHFSDRYIDLITQSTDSFFVSFMLIVIIESLVISLVIAPYYRRVHLWLLANLAAWTPFALIASDFWYQLNHPPDRPSREELLEMVFDGVQWPPIESLILFLIALIITFTALIQWFHSRNWGRSSRMALTLFLIALFPYFLAVEYKLGLTNISPLLAALVFGDLFLMLVLRFITKPRAV